MCSYLYGLLKEWLEPVGTPFKEHVLPAVMQLVRSSIDTIETVMTLRQFFLTCFLLCILFMVPTMYKWLSPEACDIDGSELLAFVNDETLNEAEREDRLDLLKSLYGLAKDEMTEAAMGGKKPKLTNGELLAIYGLFK